MGPFGGFCLGVLVGEVVMMLAATTPPEDPVGNFLSWLP